MQLKNIKAKANALQKKHGEPGLNAIYGAGCINNPNVMFIFMNPTARNISAHKGWGGLRAPWLGTKNVWQLFHELEIIPSPLWRRIQNMSQNWTENFAAEVYKQVAENKIYITNLAKCTQSDAKPLKNSVFKSYLEIMFNEIVQINPKCIISFGNQVSSILLNKPISVSDYTGEGREILTINGKKFTLYPVYYPVGQGRRNMPLAITKIKEVF